MPNENLRCTYTNGYEKTVLTSLLFKGQ